MDSQQLLSQLQGFKLKHTPASAIRDFSKPVVKSFEEEKELPNTYLEFYMHHWYPLLQSVTFETEFVELDEDELKLFVRAYEDMHITDKDKDNNKKLLSPEEVLVKYQKEFDCVAQKLQPFLNKLAPKNDDSVFVKCSSRSPKDAATATQQLQQLLEQEVNNYKQQLHKQQLNQNDLLRCLLLAATKTLRINNKQVQDLLLLFVSSERIYQDFLLALEQREQQRRQQQQQQQPEIPVHIVLRHWQNIDFDTEIRGFVSNHHLTCLSQYNHLLFVSLFQEKQQQIKEAVVKFFYKKVRPLLMQQQQNNNSQQHVYNNYVIDFAFVKDANNNVIIDESSLCVVELNPLLFTTDACCFDWKTEEQLLKGNHLKQQEQPLDEEQHIKKAIDLVLFRFRDCQVENVKSLLSDDFQQALEKLEQQ